MKNDWSGARAWEPSPWSEKPAAYAVALALWAALGIFYLPILSMILAPIWVVFFVSVLPRWITRGRREWGRRGVDRS